MVVYVYLRGTWFINPVLGGDGVGLLLSDTGSEYCAKNAEGTGIQRQLLLLSLGDQCVGNLCVGLADYGVPFSCQKKQRVKFIGDYLGHYRGQPAGFLGASGRSDLFNRDNRGADDLISDHRRHIYPWTDCAYRRA